MNRAFEGLWGLVLLGLVGVACGSGASDGKVGDAAADAAGDGDTEATAPNGEGIFAKVDGEPKSWTADPSVLPGPDLHLSAGVVGSLEAFQIDVSGSPLVGNGTHTCATGAALTYWSPGDGATPAYFRADGASGECSVTLTKSAGGVGETYEGTFTGKVVSSNDVNRTFTFTDGIFKVRR